MALNSTPKAAPSASQGNVNPVTQPRPQIRYNQVNPSTARAEALKNKITGKVPAQPAPPRRAGSSARAEQYAALTRQDTPVRPQMPAPTPKGQTSARQAQQQQPLSNIPPPPSGLSPEAQAQEFEDSLSQPTNSVEALATPSEATEEALSPQFVALAKQGKAIRRAQLEHKQAVAAFQQERDQYISKKDAQADPLKVLAELGITNERLVELQLNQENPDPNQALHDELKALRDELATVKGEFTTRDKRSHEAAMNQVRSDVKLLVDSDPAFETIKAQEDLGNLADGTEAVVDLIWKVFQAENTLIPVEEACKLVEEKLMNREFERLQKIQGLSKIKTRLAPPAEDPAEATPVQPHTQPKNKTLTNQGASQRPLSARERAIEGVLKRMSGE